MWTCCRSTIVERESINGPVSEPRKDVWPGRQEGDLLPRLDAQHKNTCKVKWSDS